MANSSWVFFILTVVLISVGLMIWHLRRGD